MAKSVDAVLAAKGREVATTWTWSTVAEATVLLAGPPRIGALVVLDDNRQIAGLLTERDLVRGVHEHGAAVDGLAVEALMSHAVPTRRRADVGDAEHDRPPLPAPPGGGSRRGAGNDQYR
ncbi:MAG: hypothetical protein L0I76_26105 [Pseudonocardia sp.]|nr:hypothetical protein [Pseudonocardia sp.]